MKKFFSLPSMMVLSGKLFLTLHNSASIMAENCAMSLWVFDTLDRCNTINPPNAVGTVYADGQCRTVETDPD